MINLTTETGRKKVCQEFNELFACLSHTNYARKLEISERTARGLRTQDRAPQKATARRMLDHIIQIRELATKDKDELDNWAEAVRLSREKKQLQIEIERIREKGICKNVPKWFVRAEKAFDKGKYEIAYAILVDRLAPEELSDVDPRLRPYALNRLGLTTQYMGRIIEAINSYKAALDVGLSEHLPKEHLVWFRTNLAGAFIRMCNSEEAIKQCKDAIDECITHIPAFYVALCASGALRDSHLLAIWIGRTIQAAKSCARPNQLEQFIKRAAVDPDLDWARNHTGWAEFIEELRASIATNNQNKGC